MLEAFEALSREHAAVKEARAAREHEAKEGEEEEPGDDRLLCAPGSRR
jgi:hypothetical protein